MDLDLARGEVMKLKTDVDQRDRLLGESISDAIVDGRLKSVLLEGSTINGDRDLFAVTDYKVRKVEFEKGQLSFEVEVSFTQTY